MAPPKPGKLGRIFRMSRDEISVRLAQEFHKGADLLRHQLGMSPKPPAIRLSASPAGQFFFSGNEVPNRAALLRQFLPGEASAIVREGDGICVHRFRLLGYENLSFSLNGGSEIDWHLDAIHQRRAPLAPWFRIPFLDFAAVGDHKVTWELNRHQHLVTLAKAFVLSDDEKYLRELIAQWRSWIAANPYPLGINWGSTLEVAFRSLSWIWIDQLLSASQQASDFRSELLPALAFHGRYIERYLSTYFSPNTHLLGEAVTMFFLGTLYPQMPRADRWQRRGWQIVLHEAGRQVRPDGVYFEQSLHYHVYALDFFLYARLLAQRNAIKVPASYDDIVQRMLDVVEALAQAGPAEGFGDDDGGRLFNPRRNRTEEMTDPLAIGSLLYHRESAAATITEEVLWLFGDRAVEQLSQPRPSPASYSISFSDGGLYVLADSQPSRQLMMIDAGPQGIGRSGHGHADALSLRLTMDGRRWLIDSGSGVYIAQDPADRNTFRATGAHNTLRVDELDQAVPDEPFSWTDIPTVQAEQWLAGKTFTYFVGSHNGYARLDDPVTHRRDVLEIAGGPHLVRDIAQGRGKHKLEVRWHFAPDLAVRKVADNRLTIAPENPSSASALTLAIPEQSPWQLDVSRTVVSPAYGAYQPAPLVNCHASVTLPTELATIFIPHAAASPDDDFSLTAMAQSTVHVYKLNYHKENQGFFFAVGPQTWSFGPWSSDARMLYCRVEDEKLVHLVVIGGTRVEWQGKPLLQATGPTEFFEWSGRDGVTNARPNAFTVTPVFETLTSTTLAEKQEEKH